MQLVLLIVVVSLVAISVIAIVTIRIRLKNKSKELSEKLNHISSYSNKSNYEQAKERLSALNNEAFIDIMNHPEMTREKELAMMDEVFGGKVSDVMMGFLQVLVKKGRFGEIESVLEYFDKRAKEYKKIGVVYVTTPAELSDAQKQKIEARLSETSSYETLEMNYNVDASLLGGIRIRIDDRVVDNTIRTKLEEMTRKLSKVRV